VLAAFKDRHELCGPFDDNWPELCLAAALRAVAPFLRDAPHDLMRTRGFDRGAAAAAALAERIADELEAQP
jgi:hypothetical protein